MRRRVLFPRLGRFIAADAALISLAFVTFFLLLASPIVTYTFQTMDELLLWTCLIAVPVAAVGIILNHLGRPR